MIGCYIDVDVGMLYYAVRQLEKEQAIVTVAQEHVIRSGVRTIYRITPKGRDEFQTGFFAQFERDDPVSQTLYDALLFFHCVDRERLKASIRDRLVRLDRDVAELSSLKDDMVPSLALGPTHLFRHLEKQRELDRTWLLDLLDALEKEENSGGQIDQI